MAGGCRAPPPAGPIGRRSLTLQICVTTQYVWPESFRVNDLVQALDAKGHQIRVLPGQPNYPDG